MGLTKPVAATGTPVIAATTCCRSSWEPPPHDTTTGSAPGCALRVVYELADRPRVCRLCLGPCLVARARPWVLGGCKLKEYHP